MVILTAERTENDVFSTLVDNGHKFDSVEKTLLVIREFLEMIPKFKIGNVVSINQQSENLELNLDFQRLTKPIVKN